MKLDDGLWSAAQSSRNFRAIFNKTWLVGSLLALSACAEGVPPFGTPNAAGSGGAGTGGGSGTSGMNGASGSSGMSGSGGASGSGGRAGASGSSGGSGSSGTGGTSGASGTGGTGGEVVPCDVTMCPEPPPPFPFVPAPAACCKDNGQCGAVDLFGGCA
jgi:hypothetical protein